MNVYIDWMNSSAHERWVVGGDLVRHLSAVVLMELEAGARTIQARRAVAGLARTFTRVGRLIHPSRDVWARAGTVLRQLRGTGREIRRASLVHDVLIALSARDLGATVITRDAADHVTIRRFADHSFLALSDISTFEE